MRGKFRKEFAPNFVSAGIRVYTWARLGFRHKGLQPWGLAWPLAGPHLVSSSGETSTGQARRVSRGGSPRKKAKLWHLRH